MFGSPFTVCVNTTFFFSVCVLAFVNNLQLKVLSLTDLENIRSRGERVFFERDQVKIKLIKARLKNNWMFFYTKS